MAVTFLSDDWRLVEMFVNKKLQDQRSVLENPNNSFRDKLIAIGYINALKAIQNLPSLPPQQQ